MSIMSEMAAYGREPQTPTPIITIEELKKRPVWVNWRYQKRGDTITKIPVNPRTGGNAMANKPETWCGYTEATWKTKPNKCDGVGLMFGSLDDGYVLAGIDIDGHREGSNTLAAEVMEMFKGTYIEPSPSGTGYHILFMVRADEFPEWNAEHYKKNPHNELECYVAGMTNRYFTYTGGGEDCPIIDCTEQLHTFLHCFMRKSDFEKPTTPPAVHPEPKVPAPVAPSAPVAPVVLDIAAMLEIARNAKNGAAFSALYDKGDTSSHNGDDSAADLALCQSLAFYFQGDYDKIDAAFRGSALMRDKWEREDYRASTINKAINSCRKFYTPPKPKATAPTSVPEPPTADEEYPFILSDKKRRWLDCIILADYIREKLPYFFVRREGSEDYRRYVYHKGVYRLISDTEFQGYIKAFICKADKTLLKMRDVREVYSMLITDLDKCKVREEQLNEDEKIINFKNGILHLDTMQLTPHSPSILSTVQLPITYTEGMGAETPLFDRFLQEFTSGDLEKQQALLEFIGACISNVNGWRFKMALFCIGDGNSGKSVLREFVNKLLGANNISGGGLDYLESRFGKLSLYGKRVYGSPDIGYVTLNQLEGFKNITGGDTIPIEAKGKDSFEYKYRGMVWFGGNAMPKFGGDRGDWVYDRMLLIKCNNVVPPEKRDKYLVDKLLTEADGIVIKALNALKQAIARGYKFTVPAESERELAKFKVENSPYLRFYQECCVPREQWSKFDGVTTAALHKALKAWCSDNTGGLSPKTQDFRKELEQYHINTEIGVYSGCRYYKTFTLSKEYREINHIYYEA